MKETIKMAASFYSKKRRTARWSECTRTIHENITAGIEKTTHDYIEEYGFTHNNILSSLRTLNRNGLKVRRIGSKTIIENGALKGLESGKICLVTKKKKDFLIAIERDERQQIGRLSSIESLLSEGKISFSDSKEVLSAIDMTLRALSTKLLETKQRLTKEEKSRVNSKPIFKRS